MRVFRIFILVAFVNLAFNASLLRAKTHCHVLHQINSKEANHKIFKSIKEVVFDLKYQPINISVGGVSLNEILLAPHDPHNVKEVMLRSKEYIKLKKFSSNIPREITMRNDWDTYEVQAFFLPIDLDESDHFAALMTIAWDDIYTLHLDCLRQN